MSETALGAGSGVRWSAKDRDTWLELFVNFSVSAVSSTLEQTVGLKNYPEEQLKTDVTLSAELADFAMQEVAYRFHKHPHQSKERAKRK